MRSIEVLVAAINQKDPQLYYDLRLCTNAVIANQTDSNWYEEYYIDGKLIKLVSTKDKGVGRNRNIALLNSSAEICLIADQDLVYVSNYQEIIDKAFDDIPNADIILFNIGNLEARDKRMITKIQKVNLLNFARYGAPRMAIKRDSLLKANIYFSLLFGGGAKYSCGEDTLFFREALRKGLKIYTYPEKIADAQDQESTWFKGYNKKFFFDRGVLMANTFPIIKYLTGVYMALRFKAKSEFTYLQAIMLVFSGISAFSKNISYNEWEEYRHNK